MSPRLGSVPSVARGFAGDQGVRVLAVDDITRRRAMRSGGGPRFVQDPKEFRQESFVKRVATGEELPRRRSPVNPRTSQRTIG